MSPARSTLVTIINNTSLELILENRSLDHGEWCDVIGPRPGIGPKNQEDFQVESVGFMNGDQTSVTYSSGAGLFNFTFDNPLSGSNDYSENAFDRYTTRGGGDNASVTWTIASRN